MKPRKTYHIHEQLHPNYRVLYIDLMHAAAQGSTTLQLVFNALTAMQQHQVTFLYPKLYELAYQNDNTQKETLL